MAKLRTALFWNSLQSLGLMGVNVLSLFVLSRILSPADYGVYGVLMIFISMSELLADCGIGGYLIKKQDVTEIYYDTLFLFNMGVSILLYFTMFLCAPFIAHFYDNTALIPAIRILGLVVIIQAFSITQRTRLLKNLKFRAMALIVLTASIAGFFVAFALAYNGFSYWALIWQNITFCALTTSLYVLVNRSIPRCRFNFNVFKEQFAFGINLFASSLLQTLTNNVSNNVIAKIFNLRTTGLYVQASKMQSYPVSIITVIIDRTFFPILSKQNDNILELKRSVYDMQRLLYAFLMPCFTILICYAKEIVLLVLGNQWVECSFIFQLLMLASYFMLMKAINRSVLKSLGETFSILKSELYAFVALVIGMAVATWYKSLYVLVLSVVAAQCVSALCSALYLKRKANFYMSKQLVDFLTFIAISAIPCLVLLFDLTIWLKIGLTIVVIGISLIVSRMAGIKEYDCLFNIATSAMNRISKMRK